MDRPGKIVCVGRNYREHAKELGNEVPAAPLLFLKPPSAIVTDGAAIVMPRASTRVDFEGEVGVIVGAPLRRATAGRCAAAIRAVVAVNDVTARDLQKTDGQWARAKGFDSFCPVGEPADPPALDALTVVTLVDGAERQRGDTRDLVFPIADLLAYISGVMTLEPGDLVVTGTPSGVGPLSAGQVVTVEVRHGDRLLSRVTNPVIAED